MSGRLGRCLWVWRLAGVVLVRGGVIAQAADMVRKRVELTRPRTYKESNCRYVVTKDVVAKGTGFAFEGTNCNIDLGGHTLTFNTRDVPLLGLGRRHRWQ